jgi:ferrochelatase
MQQVLGILLSNIGTPAAPNTKAVRSYLGEFLADPRVVRLPRFIWLPLLYGIILPFRASHSAKLYQNIWTDAGSPLQVNMSDLSANLATYISKQAKREVLISYGMHYGQPSIVNSVAELYAKGVRELLVLAMFPQYSSSTTETTYDQIKKLSGRYPDLVIKYVKPYAEHPAYIAALSTQINAYYHDKQYLLFSFHGIPKSFVAKGDPYANYCYKTANLVAEHLQLKPRSWSVAFQSRFGYADWLEPYTVTVLEQLPQRGIIDLAVVCPGFAVDCLETLEEIAMQAKSIFLEHGGRSFTYIPALNASKLHLAAISAILSTYL